MTTSNLSWLDSFGRSEEQDKEFFGGTNFSAVKPQKKEPGLFDGTGEALLYMAPNAFFQTMGGVEEMSAYKLSQMYELDLDNNEDALSEPIKADKDKIIQRAENEAKYYRLKAKNDWTPNPETTGAAAQMIHAMGSTILKAAGYSVIAGGNPYFGGAMFGVDIGLNEYGTLRDKGVDAKTARQAGWASGALNALGLAIPGSIGTSYLKSAALGAIVNPASDILEQASIKYILENADYEKIAGEYDPFNPANLAVSSGVGIAFGLMGAKGARSRAIRAEKFAQQDAEEAQRRAQENPDQSQAEEETKPVGNSRLNQDVLNSIQNRDRSSQESVIQMRKITEKPDFNLISESRVLENGSPVIAFVENPNPKTIGKEVVVSASDGRRMTMRYAVVEADSILTSNDVEGFKNPEFANPNVLGARAIAGNGRVAGVKSAYQHGTAGDYRAELMDQSKQFGISRRKIKNMRQPILVRIMKDEDVKTDVGELSNRSGIQKLNPVEQAEQDARNVNVEEGVDEQITSAQVDAAMEIKMSKIMTDDQPSGPNGNINKSLQDEATAREQIDDGKKVEVSGEGVDPEVMDKKLSSFVTRFVKDLVGAGADKKVAGMNAQVIDAFFSTMGVRLGKSRKEIEAEYELKVQKGEAAQANSYAQQKTAEQKLAEESKKWSSTVEQLKKKPTQSLLMLTQTPLSMKLVGAEFRELYVHPHVFDGMFPNAKKSSPNHHSHIEMSAKVLKQIPSALADPVAIYYDERNNSFVFALEIKDENNNYVMVPVAFNATGRKGTINLVKTALGRGISYYDSQGANNAIRYVNKKKCQRWFPTSGAVSLFDSNADGTSVLTETDLVKERQKYPGYYQTQNEAPLVTVHNLSEENLNKAMDLGGLAVPSLGITKRDTAYTDFGDISLIGTKDMVDPRKGTPVFSQDAYTQTFPEPVWEKSVKPEGAKEVSREFEAAAKESGFTDEGQKLTHSLQASPNRQNFIHSLLTSNVGAYLFLKSKGIKVDPVMTKPGNFSKIVTDSDFIKVAEEIYKTDPTLAESKNIKRLSDAYIESFEKNGGEGGPLVRKIIARAKENGTPLKKEKLRSLMSEAIESKKNFVPTEDKLQTGYALKDKANEYRGEFEKWAEKQADKAFSEPMIKVGNQLKPITLENVVKAMKSSVVVNKEKTMTVGAGKVRARSAQKFKSIEEIQNNRDKVTDSETTSIQNAYIAGKMERFRQLASKDSNFQDSFDAFNEAMDSLAKVAGSRGKITEDKVRAELKKRGFDASDETVKLGVDILERLDKSLTDYFEAKPQRAVKFNEFAGAVVPKKTSPETIARLEKEGIKVAIYDETLPDGRQKAITELTDSLQNERKDVLYQSAYHGSPHRFDEFSTDFIGSGEGAQAHGWGLYFAKDKRVAENYRRVLTAKKFLEEFENKYDLYDKQDWRDFAQALRDGDIELDPKYQKLWDAVEKENYLGYSDFRSGFLEYIRDPEAYGGPSKVIDEALKDYDGRLFELDIPETNTMLDEQLTFYKQPPEVQKAVWDLLVELEGEGARNIDLSKVTGRKLLKYLEDVAKYSGQEGAQKWAALQLNKHGIKGISYDGRRDGRCFVVFDDQAVKIMEYFQGDRQTKGAHKGIYTPGERVITLLQSADESTFVHESGHYFLDVLTDIGSKERVPKQIKDDIQTLMDWFGVKDLEEWNSLSFEDKRQYHEKFARGFEQYLREGKAPSSTLEKVFKSFKDWLMKIYKSAEELDVELSPEVRAVYDRLLATDEQIKQRKAELEGRAEADTSTSQRGSQVPEQVTEAINNLPIPEEAKGVLKNTLGIEEPAKTGENHPHSGIPTEEEFIRQSLETDSVRDPDAFIVDENGNEISLKDYMAEQDRIAEREIKDANAMGEAAQCMWRQGAFDDF